MTRYGERVVGSLGMIGLMTGLAWLSRLTPESGYLDGLFGPFLLLGLGAGLTIAPLTAVIMHNAPREHLGAASSLNQAMRQLGGAVGLAVLSTMFANTASASGTATVIWIISGRFEGFDSDQSPTPGWREHDCLSPGVVHFEHDGDVKTVRTDTETSARIVILATARAA